MDIRDSTAVVTGAASGLGAATAAELVARGARVIGLDLPQVVHADNGAVIRVSKE